MRIKEKNDCAFCLDEFVENQEVSKLACNEHHYFHTDCVKGLIDFNKKANKTTYCPLCRTEIVESAI
jgi:hypothetical protein